MKFSLQLLNPPISPWQLVLITALWIATVGNVALWVELAQHIDGVRGLRGFALSACFAIFIGGMLAGLSALFAWSKATKFICGFWVIASAIAAHFMLSYRVVIDSTMITNALHTDPREVRDLLSWKFLATVLLIAAPAIWFIWRVPLKAVAWTRHVLHNLGLLLASFAIGILALWPVFQDFASLMRNYKHVRYLINPLNSVVALGQIAVGDARIDDKLHPIGEGAKIGPRWAAPKQAPLLLLVVGETARYDHFGINGYSRETTPKLRALGDEVTTFAALKSCGTNTAVSLPCMFSHLGQKAWNDRRQETETLLHLLHRAGFAVLWIDNQSGCKRNCEGLPTVNTAELKTAPYCDSGECHDEVMLSVLEGEIAKLDPARRAKGTIVAMHQMGSHGPAYYKRVPPAFAQFTPECKTNQLQACERQLIVNSYDNTILYTDHLLAQTVAWLKRRSEQHAGAMIYLSDHGESLGENNLYLHGLPYAIAPDTQKRVPQITWFSKSFSEQAALPSACVKTQAKRSFTHDNYFHMITGLLDVQTPEYKRDLDPFAGCR
jgi:lipid A ethanolaminephosphotransferase